MSKMTNDYNIPQGCKILTSGEPLLIKNGKCAGESRNMYWKVKDNNNIYYLMHIKDDVFTKVSECDLDKLLKFKGTRNTWRLFMNGYVCCTIKDKVYYLHQVIMNVHDEDLTSLERTVDHINCDKLDNRKENLRLVDMSTQNSNRGKSKRRVDACELPGGITQKNLPKYVVYRKEILDKEDGKYREFFVIDQHPKLAKPWETTKSMKIGILEKLESAKTKLDLLNKVIDEKQYNEKTGLDTTIDLPVGIRLNDTNNKYQLIYDYKDTKTKERFGLRMVLKSTDLQKELDTFIGLINEKYPNLNFAKYQIKNIPAIGNNQVSPVKEVNEDAVKLTLPPNFSLYNEKGTNYFQYNKVINKVRHSMKSCIKSDNFQKEFDSFIDSLNKKYPELQQPKYVIPNI